MDIQNIFITLKDFNKADISTGEKFYRLQERFPFKSIPKSLHEFTGGLHEPFSFLYQY